MSNDCMRTTAIEAYSALEPARQLEFLARLASEITIWTRHAYPQLVQDDSKSAQLLAAHNELQHRVVEHLAHLSRDNRATYPDDVLVNILFDMADGAGCTEQMTQTFADLYSSFVKATGGTKPKNS